jgi:hypothetical protein
MIAVITGHKRHWLEARFGMIAVIIKGKDMPRIMFSGPLLRQQN